MDAMKDSSWDCYLVVRDPSTGKTDGRGDAKLAYKHILAEKSKKKRESGEWIPSTPIPKLPSRLNKMMSDTVAVRNYSSTLIKYIPKMGRSKLIKSKLNMPHLKTNNKLS